jgi:recombinational DNA repair protein (RecF pathway)
MRYSLNKVVRSLKTDAFISSGLSCLAEPVDCLVENESSSTLFSCLLSSLENVLLNSLYKDDVLPLLFGTGPLMFALGMYPSV